MEKSLEKPKRERMLTLGTAIIVVGMLIIIIILYRGNLTAKATGNTIKDNQIKKILTESEASTKLVEFLNKKYGDAKFYRSEDLGSLYLVVIKHEKQNYDFFITKDGNYFSNSIEKIEIQSNETNNTG